jgi:4-hydroxy-tetrahydrodipicolinate synthase
MTPITGSIVALVTPMHDDGSVDYPTLRKLIDWHIAEGTDCIGVVGTTGESPTVNVEEHCEIIRVSVEQAAGRVPIMAGCGANSTSEAIELARFAKKSAPIASCKSCPITTSPRKKASTSTSRRLPKRWTCPPAVQRARPLVADMAHDTVLRWPRCQALWVSKKPPATSSAPNG